MASEVRRVMLSGEERVIKVDNSTLNGVLVIDPVPTIIIQGIEPVPSSSIEGEGIEEVGVRIIL